jgi:hypothetical protein
MNYLAIEVEDYLFHKVFGSLERSQRIRKPTWRKCADGGKHNIIRHYGIGDCYDWCTKCGMTGN